VSLREDLDRRYLAAVRVVDATTGAAVSRPLSLRSATARFAAPRPGIYVVVDAAGLEHHAAAFDAPPPAPPTGSVAVAVDIVDVTGFYLPRRMTLVLPRAAQGADSVLEPVVVALYRSALAGIAQSWAVIRGGLVDAGTGLALPAALLRVVRDVDGAVLAVSMSTMASLGQAPRVDPRVVGQIAVPIPGIAVSIWGDDGGSVVLDSLAVTLEVVPIPASGAFPDPDQYVQVPANASNRWPFQVATGRQVNAGTLPVTVAV
jgi:hypothetical protein